MRWLISLCQKTNVHSMCVCMGGTLSLGNAYTRLSSINFRSQMKLDLQASLWVKQWFLEMGVKVSLIHRARNAPDRSQIYYMANTLGKSLSFFRISMPLCTSKLTETLKSSGINWNHDWGSHFSICLPLLKISDCISECESVIVRLASFNTQSTSFHLWFPCRLPAEWSSQQKSDQILPAEAEEPVCRQVS